MSAHARTDQTPRTITLDRPTQLKLGAGAAVAALALVLLVRSSGADAPPAAAPQILSGPTTSTAPAAIDPLANLGVLNPTAAALVGTSFDGRRELARRASEVMTQSGVDQCHLVIGATSAGSWEISTLWGPAHPIVLMAGCAFPPAADTTTTVKAGG